jgi:hypothetical protein
MRRYPVEYPCVDGAEQDDMTHAKKIGFLSFGAWHPGGGLTRSAGGALHQTVELAVTAEEIGIDGAFVRVHHFAQQLASPFPLLSAIGVKTSRIEIGTGVIDVRYENPLYMAETAAAADLLGRRPPPAGHWSRFAGAGLARRGAAHGGKEVPPAARPPYASGCRWCPARWERDRERDDLPIPVPDSNGRGLTEGRRFEPCRPCPLL